MENPRFEGPAGEPHKAVCLTVDAVLIPRFHPMLQAGFFVKARVGKSIDHFLCEQMGISPHYVQEKISTIFLDGKPVDDIDSAVIREGSVLALSSAMPGLVGATMRRKGFYASLRSTITHADDEGSIEEKEGFFRVKVFNLLMADLAFPFFERGICVPSRELEEFFASQGDLFFGGIRGMTLDGQSADPGCLRKAGWPSGYEWALLKLCK
jgi:hypothetical protein